MSNPINKSGKYGEKRMKKFLDMYFTNGFDYNPSDGIDFIVHPAAKLEDRFYIDIKNQNGAGGRDLAVGGCVWDYQDQNGFKECYIVEGEFDFMSVEERDNVNYGISALAYVNEKYAFIEDGETITPQEISVLNIYNSGDK